MEVDGGDVDFGEFLEKWKIYDFLVNSVFLLVALEVFVRANWAWPVIVSYLAKTEDQNGLLFFFIVPSFIFYVLCSFHIRHVGRIGVCS